MQRSPITCQRSAWRLDAEFEWGAWWVRPVGDGTLRALVAEEPAGWHMSISFVDRKDQPTRYPTWDEIAHARDELLPDDIDFVMWLPKTGDYVALHDTTFHLHEHPGRI